MSAFAIHIIIITILDFCGIMSAKYWSIYKSPWFLVLTTILFGTAGFVFAKSLRYEGAAIMNVLWIALSVVAVTLFGYFFFNENISTAQFAGIFVIMIGLILINL